MTASDLQESSIVREWEHSGLKCLVVLKRDQVMEWLCGYVAVRKGHPDWGKNYDDVDVDAHGGLTFGAQGKEGETCWKDPELWWFGFDCSHAFDATYRDEWLRDHPDFPHVKTERDHKWTADEAIAETERLAEQLARRLPRH